MNFDSFPEDMGPQERNELHSIQLRMAADELDEQAYRILVRSTHVLDQAEGMLAEIKNRPVSDIK